MAILEGILQFLNIFAAAIVAGGQMVVLRVIIPTKRRFEPRESVMVHNAMLGHQIDHYMKPSGIISGVLAIALVLLGLGGYLALTPTAIAFTLIGLVGTLGVVLTSRYGNVPTNRMMATWSLDAIPENYPEIRRRWDSIHTLRASCGLLALTGYLIAGLVD